jgi:hypothetical protein
MYPYNFIYAKAATDVSLLHSIPAKQFLLTNIDTGLYRWTCGRCDEHVAARGST